MKAYDLKPTHENLMKTFTEDTVGRNIDVLRFAKILNAIEGSYSIALDGNWGSGKTFFVKQTKMVLDANNENIQVLTKGEKEEITNACLRCAKKARLPELQPQVCVYYDAWENDNDEDPILSLIYTILNNVDTDFSFKNHSCIEAAASLMEFFVGRNWKQVINSLKASSPLDGLKQAKDIEQLVHEFLNSLLPEKEIGWLYLLTSLTDASQVMLCGCWRESNITFLMTESHLYFPSIPVNYNTLYESIMATTLTASDI